MTKPKRRTRNETRELVVGAALELVREHGLGVEPTSITYQRVFDHLEATTGVRITRASVHERLWASQEEFQVDVLLRVSRMETGLGAAADVAAESLAATSSLPPEVRMRELARLAPTAVLEIAAADPLFYSWVGFTLSLAKDSATEPSTRQKLAQRTAAEYSETEVKGAEFVRLLATAIGVAPRRDLFRDADEGYLFIARVGLTLAEGATIRMRFDGSELPDIELKTGLDGEEQTWTAFAAGYWALLNTFLEIDPDADLESP
ncbi:MAG: hypothetical protein R2707_20005 [Acidimicrobiales bacterium]